MFAFLKKEPEVKTIDSVIGDIQRKISELGELAKEHSLTHERKIEQIRVLAEQRDIAAAEALRARGIADKLMNLINP